MLALGALQGLIGWWMVASGLEARVYVAPERLATHLGLALAIYALAVWTGWEAWSGRPRGGDHYAPPSWIGWATGLAGLIFLQMLLGGLVAGNHAGLVYNDWPLMDGRFVPREYAASGAQGHGLWATLVHSQAAVQFDHRVVAYLVFFVVAGLALSIFAARNVPSVLRMMALALIFVVTVQVLLGIATVMMAAPLWLSLIHQLWAVVLLTTSLALVWRMRRS